MIITILSTPITYRHLIQLYQMEINDNNNNNWINPVQR